MATTSYPGQCQWCGLTFSAPPRQAGDPRPQASVLYPDGRRQTIIPVTNVVPVGCVNTVLATNEPGIDLHLTNVRPKLANEIWNLITQEWAAIEREDKEAAL